MKTCSKCKAEKAFDAFGPRKEAPDGLRSECRTCCGKRHKKWRDANLENQRPRERANAAKRRQRDPEGARKNSRTHAWRDQGIDITFEKFVEMRTAQQGKCAICQQEPANGRSLHVDHCHATGRVRALLCGRCNRGIGKLRESPAILRQAADYLEKHHG